MSNSQGSQDFLSEIPIIAVVGEDGIWTSCYYPSVTEGPHLAVFKAPDGRMWSRYILLDKGYNIFTTLKADLGILRRCNGKVTWATPLPTGNTDTITIQIPSPDVFEQAVSGRPLTQKLDKAFCGHGRLSVVENAREQDEVVYHCDGCGIKFPQTDLLKFVKGNCLIYDFEEGWDRR